MISLMKSKLHNIPVTEANPNYMGSVTIDEDYMDDVNLIENEQVQVLNKNNGERIWTYVIKGERGSKTIGINGPAAQRFTVGDKIIIISYAIMDYETAKNFKPLIKMFESPDDLINLRLNEENLTKPYKEHLESENLTKPYKEYIESFKKFEKDVTSTKEKAIEFLQSIGYLPYETTEK